MLNSLEIAQKATPMPIAELAQKLGLLPDEVKPYGRFMGKLGLATLGRLADRPDGKLVVVTAITPTPLGEGKTTTAIGLVDGLNRIGVRAAVTLRQPSLGPIFGIKGGATGGGYAQLLPMEQINLHLTGDFHAVAAAHNLAAAFLDNHLHFGNPLGIDLRTIDWPRVVDMNDRALRSTVIGLGGREGGVPRETEWNITAASEVMAILSLSKDLADLRSRLGRIVLAQTSGGALVTAEDLKAAGAMAVLLREAIEPNLLQTLEGNPALIHTGPFGNIAQGTSSVLADRLGLKLFDLVVTEAGFGADLGAEKLFDIKLRQSGLRPAAAVLVATVRALKMHGGAGKVVAGKPLDPALESENVEALRRGGENLAKQIENVRTFGVPVVVAINHFPTDTAAEVEAVREVAQAAGARATVVSRHFEEGGRGAEQLAAAVRDAANEGAPDFELLYPDDWPLVKKVEAIATRMYGADGLEVQPKAGKQLDALEAMGFRELPVCMAKTHLSLSHDPELKGRPRGFKLPVREARLSAGAGFVTVLAGEIRLMPGLGSRPSGEGMDLDSDGRIVGLR